MGILSGIKSGAIALLDQLDKLNDPFDPFTRPLFVKDSMPLLEKAYRFERDMLQHFMLRDGAIMSYKLPVDLGDQAMWHGHYVAAFCLKYAVEPTPALESGIEGLVYGLALHQPGGMLIRGIDEGGNRAFDASNDSATGHLVGLHFLLKHGPASCRAPAEQLLVDWAWKVNKSGNALTNPDGKTTTYGALENGWKTDPLRMTLLMAMVASASQLDSGQFLRPVLRVLISKYRALVPYPKVRLWWLDTGYDTQRAAAHLSILWDSCPELRPECEAGLRRIWRMVGKSGNSWIAFLCKRAVPALEIPRGFDLLQEFGVEEKGPLVAKNMWRDARLSEAGVKFFLWNNDRCASQPVPIWLSGTQDWVWQRNLYSTTRWTGANETALTYNGGDFLAPYWGGRLLGEIKA